MGVSAMCEIKRGDGEMREYTGDRPNGVGWGEHVRKTRACERICHFTDSCRPNPKNDERRQVKERGKLKE